MAILSADNLFRALLPPEDISKDPFTGEAAGLYHSTLYVAGRPGAGVAPSPGLAGLALTSYAGQVSFPAPASGKNVYLAGLDFLAGSSVSGAFLADRLWHNSGIVVTTTTGQTINSAAWPARDMDGTINGRGIIIAIEVSTATTNAGAITNTTLSYTNSLGVAGRTATMASFPATAVAGTLIPFSLQAGDVGVQSIQSITLGTSYAAGAIHLVAMRRISPLVGRPNTNVPNRYGPLEVGLVRCFDNTVPWPVYILSGTAADATTMTATWAQG